MVQIGAGIDNRDGAGASQLGCRARIAQANDAGRGLTGVVAGNRAAKERDQGASRQGIKNAGAGLSKHRLRQAELNSGSEAACSGSKLTT